MEKKFLGKLRSSTPLLIFSYSLGKGILFHFVALALGLHSRKRDNTRHDLLRARNLERWPKRPFLLLRRIRRCGLR